MRISVIFVALIISSSLLYSQKDVNPEQLTLKSLTHKEQIELASLPELKLPVSYKNKSVPYEVDNTIQTCYSGLFQQSGLCCGQAACVGNGFTYEINRIRELDGSLTENKYPTHFTWNWENGGNGYHGASYYHSLAVLKIVGNPNMVTYGGTHDYGGDQRFMSGYDEYYEGMHNRISKAYAINCSTEEGIMTLKHWLNDHLDGSDIGGMAFFYSQYQSPTNTLPFGTEHAGEKVIISWGASPNHGMTITGYNDSIRWDFNGDGYYTNDIDITGDGIVDPRDWEIGGFKMNNTYGTPYDGWMMYRTLALASNEGGIWNHTANVLYPIKEYSPLLTYKVNLYYSNRQRIKIMAGVSSNLTATEPDYYMSFPIVDYQGGEQSMQGGTEEDAKYIELGLDVSPLLHHFNSGTPLKFFFQVLENDDDSWGSGEIQSFSLIDYYTGSPVEYACSESNVSIVQNGVTTVSVEHTPVFDSPEITTATLPNANVYHDYEYQMEATGGTSPYRWEFDMDYSMSEMAGALPAATTNLSGTYIDLPFEFEFYGETYTGFYLKTNGLIDFTGESYSLPYNNNSWSANSVSFLHRKSIAAFFSNTTFNVYYTSGADYYVIRWEGSGIDVSMQLESDGTVSIYYNDITPTNDQVWSSGVSYGDLLNYTYTPQSGGMESISGIGYEFVPMTPPEIFTLSEDGLLTGTPTDEILAYPLNFKVTDAKGMVDKKTIPISTEGLIIDYEIVTSNNDQIEWGENVDVNLTVRNATESIMSDLTLTLTCENTDVTINDGTELITSLNPLEELPIANAFNFDVNFNLYNEEEITLHLVAETGASTWEIDLIESVYTADIELLEYIVDDSDNNLLDIDETSDVIYTFVNEGGIVLHNAIVTVTSSDPFLTINSDTYNLGSMNPFINMYATFNFTSDPTCPVGHVAVLNFHITGDNGYENDIEGYVSIGKVFEDWETAGLETYNWSQSGDVDWFITDENPFEGTYCLKSGDIVHEQNSVLEIELEVISAGQIKFFRKVSCEDDTNNDNWDYLAFYIDDVEQGRWDGIVDWSQVVYPVYAGVHNFKWVYHKDGSVDANDDCAWIDLIEFPSIYDAVPLLTISTTEINKSMYPDENDTETLYISNQGGGIITYEIEIFDDVPWLTKNRSVLGSSISCSANSFHAGDTVEWVFTALNLSDDAEWIEEIIMDFPEGFYIDSLTDYFDQSEDTLLLTDGTPGDGAEFTWFGENADGWGLIVGGEIANTTVYGRINEDFYGDMTVNYTMTGDIYGEEPHFIDSSLTIINFGPTITWISAQTTEGALGIGQEDEIILDFNTTGMIPGEYSCNLKIFASTDTITIPVNLTVLDPVGVVNDVKTNISIYPNPTKDLLHIKSNAEIQEIKVINSLGQLVLNKSVKSFSIDIDVDDWMPGIYYIDMVYKDSIQKHKIIVN